MRHLVGRGAAQLEAQKVVDEARKTAKEFADRQNAEATARAVEATRAAGGRIVSIMPDRAPYTRPLMEKLGPLREWAFIMPLSALKGANVNVLAKQLLERMPDGPPLYPEGQVVGHDLSFTISELVREKLMRSLAQELPYALTVETEALEQEGAMLKASAIIWVERDGQKKIVIGENGEMLKRIGTAARKELETMTGRKVFLKLWVRVKEGWTDDPKALSRFGYEGG